MKQIRLGSQYFFYMETQTALAVPDEDNSIVVYSSCQIPQYVHSTVATCLGIPENKVRVIARRVGGGFGGKAVKAMPVSFFLNVFFSLTFYARNVKKLFHRLRLQQRALLLLINCSVLCGRM